MGGVPGDAGGEGGAGDTEGGEGQRLEVRVPVGSGGSEIPGRWGREGPRLEGEVGAGIRLLWGSRRK